MSNQFISLDLAIEMTTKYRDNREAVLDPAYRDRNVLPTCESFDRSVFDQVLAQPDCVGIRVYLGMDQECQVKVIVVGTDAKGQDILPPAGEQRSSAQSATQNSGSQEGLIIEQGVRCPFDCPPASPLNQ